MPKRGLDNRIDQLRELRSHPPDAETLPTLRKALADRSSLVVAEAAKTAGRLRLSELIPDLVAAFERMLEDGAKQDPQCRAKKTVIEALKAMDHSDSAVFVRGLGHIQMEPVWGGHEDTAAPLRGSCVLALIQCADLRRSSILRHVLDALTDPADSVRIDAARALEQLEGDDAALLLRLKARLGDENPRVSGQTMESLLTIEAEQAVPFVSGFLESKKGEIFEEAALALGASRLPQALEALKKAWQRERNRPRGDAILRLIAASRRPDGIEFLVSLVREGSDRDASIAAKALEIHREATDIQQQVEEALRARRK